MKLLKLTPETRGEVRRCNHLVLINPPAKGQRWPKRLFFEGPSGRWFPCCLAGRISDGTVRRSRLRLARAATQAEILADA